jgi:Helitron helicase-like domain at N-terminus
MWGRINQCLDIFVTMTINPNDPDIKENLPKGVPAHYMPHLVTRVAYLKFKRLMDEVVKEGMICMWAHHSNHLLNSIL